MLSLVMLACEAYLRNAHWLELFSCLCRTRVPFRISLGLWYALRRWRALQFCNVRCCENQIRQGSPGTEETRLGDESLWHVMVQYVASFCQHNRKEGCIQASAKKLNNRDFLLVHALMCVLPGSSAWFVFEKVGSIGRWDDRCKLLHP